MPESWTEARNKYQYPKCGSIDLSTFADAHKYQDRGWFDCSFKGDLRSTQAFQDRFRENAPYHLGAWYEVVYWKLYSMPRNRKSGKMPRDETTQRVISRLKRAKVAPERLWALCQNYLNQEDENSFHRLRENFFSSEVVAVAATFPAFLNPEKFPMVDSQIANWMRKNHEKHSYGPDFTIGDSSIDPNNWDFVELWIKWCRFTASKLHMLTGDEWSARDVEMAVFTAQTAKPKMTLKPLCADNQ